MRFILLLLAVICFAAVVLLSLFGGSSGDLNLLALGLTLFAGSFLVDARP